MWEPEVYEILLITWRIEATYYPECALLATEVPDIRTSIVMGMAAVAELWRKHR